MNQKIIDRLNHFFEADDTANFNSLDYIHRFVSPIYSILLADLFWPEFKEISGMIFLANSFEDESDQRLLTEAEAKYNGDQEKIEESFNVVEIPSLFGRHVSDIDDEQYVMLANTLICSWRAKLSQDFPEKEFCFQILGAEGTGGELAILFKQKLPEV
ncbi:hypothetical protein P4E94_17830 [Pontiellaceae bacterium B12219]|nr:hypothetical protein [Pontiellaceae bacterium B12219]